MLRNFTASGRTLARRAAPRQPLVSARRAFSENREWTGTGAGGQNHWSHRLVTKLPGNNLNAQAFMASVILCGVLCFPKWLMSRGKDVKPGESMFDQEQPETIQLQRAEARREQARQRAQ